MSIPVTTYVLSLHGVIGKWNTLFYSKVLPATVFFVSVSTNDNKKCYCNETFTNYFPRVWGRLRRNMLECLVILVVVRSCRSPLLVHVHFTSLAQTSSFSLTSNMSAGWSIGDAATFWASWHATSILQYPVSLRREQQLADRRRERVETIQDQEDTFVRVHRLQNSQEESIIETSEAEDLEFWAKYQSWTFCATYGRLDPRKLLPPFRKRTASPLFTACKCSKGTYEVPTTDDVPLILRRLTVEDQRVLSPFQVHCGDYRRMFNGYHQRTGPFRVSWCSNPVRDQIDQIVDEDRRDTILEAYYYLLNSPQSSYSQFIRMQLCGERRPFLYEIYSSPRYCGVECALWPALYGQQVETFRHPVRWFIDRCCTGYWQLGSYW